MQVCTLHHPAISARSRRLDVSARCIPSIPTLLPLLTCSEQPPASRPAWPAGRAATLWFSQHSALALPVCFPCMFTLSCPARARLPGIVLCLALLAPARPALCPQSPSPLLILVSSSRDTRVLFSELSFRFLIPFCGSTKRVGPFVLPQKGRPVPSLFLSLLSQIFGSWGHLLERFCGAGFFGIWLRGWGWAGEIPESLTILFGSWGHLLERFCGAGFFAFSS
jgi:hypothetical protein